MTSLPLHFPQELLDRFVDDLGEEYLNSFTFNYGDQVIRVALQACLSVSRSFHDRAAIYLFRQVLLTDKAGREMSTRLSLLREIMTPTVDGQILGITPYIQRFTLILNGSRPSTSLELYRENNEGQQDVIKNLSNKDLSAILRDLRSETYGIEILVIRIVTMRNVKWTRLPPHFQSAMLFLIRSPHLTSLQLHKFSRLPPTLLNGTTLKDVRLEQLDMSDREAPESPIDYPPNPLPCPKLEVFQTDNAFPVDFDPITSPLSQLKKLKTYSLLPEHYRDTSKILQLAYHSLEVLRLDFSGTCSHYLCPFTTPRPYHKLFDSESQATSISLPDPSTSTQYPTSASSPSCTSAHSAPPSDRSTTPTPTPSATSSTSPPHSPNSPNSSSNSTSTKSTSAKHSSTHTHHQTATGNA